MKWSTATLLLLCCALLAVGGKAIFNSEELTPAEALAAVERRVESGEYDERLALRELDRTLDDPRVASDPDLRRALLLTKSDVLRDLEAFSEARTTLRRLVDLGLGTPAARLQIAELEILEGDTGGARASVRALLEDAPDYGRAWWLLGRLETRRGDELVEQAVAIARRQLVETDAEDAARLLRELGARDLPDEGRIQLKHALRELFLPRFKDELTQVFDRADEASRVFSAARSSFARSFAQEVDPVGAREFVDLLVRAGRPDLAVGFGVAAMSLPDVRGDQDFMISLIRACQGQGHHRRASDLASTWSVAERPDTRPEMAEAIMSATAAVGNWRAMGDAAKLLIDVGRPALRSQAEFFRAKMSLDQARRVRATAGEQDLDPEERRARVAQRRGSLFRRAADWFAHYLTDSPVEPYPGAIAEASFDHARALRGSGQDELEYLHLSKAVSEHPRTDGQAYVRLVELQRARANVGHRVPERNWTIAMSLLPERTAEMLPTWVELGERSLRAEQQDFERVLATMLDEGRSLPVADIGPHTRYRIARRHLDSGRYRSAVIVARELRVDFPGLLPALDTLIEASLARKLDRDALDLVIERLSMVGVDEKTRTFLDRIDRSAYTPGRLMAAMRADPFGAGRAVVAGYFLDTSAPARAWRALSDTAGRALKNDPLGLVRGRTLNALGRHEEAAQELEPLAAQGAIGGQLLEALVEAHVGAGDTAAVGALADRLVAQASVDRPATLAVVDRMLERSLPEQAGRLLARLDDETELRGGDVLMRMALSALLAGDHAAAQVALERAEAFVADGSLELLRVLIAIDERGWTRLPQLVADVRASELQPTAFQDAILSLLEERLEAGNQMAESALREQPTNAEWMLVRDAARMLVADDVSPPPYAGAKAAAETEAVLRGGADSLRDPREVLGILLALEVEDWAVWAAPRVFRLGRDGGGQLWPTYLGARVFAAMRREDMARSSLERLVKRFHDFGPGWDALLLEYYAQHPSNPYHGRILKVRRDRVRAVGRVSSDDPLQIAIDAASALVLAGKLDAAAKHVQGALDETDPTTNRGRDLLARLYWQTGRSRLALVEYERACEDLEPGSEHALVAEFLGVLRKALEPARGREQLSPERIDAHLDSLEARFPRDPLIPLERTRLEIELDPMNTGLFVSRALRNLEGLRERSGGTPLDALRPGSARAWCEYLLDIAPQVAQDLLEHDLGRTPGNLDLWLLLARAYEARGRTDEALALFEVVIGMSSDAETHRSYARLLTVAGGDWAVIARHLDVARRSGDGKEPPEASLVRARAMLQSSPPQVGRAIGILERLWEDREQIGDSVDLFRVGASYAGALLQQRRAEDLETLRGLTVQLEAYSDLDPYGQETLDVLKGIQTHVEPAESPPR